MNQTRRFLLFLFTLAIISLQAQPELGECDKAVEPLAETQLPKAMRAWKTGNMSEAQRYLQKAVDFDPNYAHAHYLLGELYLRKRQLGGVEAMWEKVIKVCPDYNGDIYYKLGILYVETGRVTRGQKLLQAYLEHPDRDPGRLDEVEAILNESKIIEHLKANPVPYNPRPVPGISTNADEYLGCLSPDMELFFFTRRSRKRNKYAGPAGGARLVEEFSLSTRLNGNNIFPRGEAMKDPFNARYNEGGPSVTASNSELFFTVCQPNDTGYLNCDIWYTKRFGEDWSRMKPLPAPINMPDSWESQPSVSANGDQLYFASNRTTGLGGIDIYVCHRQADGSWSVPSNVGRPINTSKDEKTPFLHSDSRTLYFSSNGHPGMGGFDIFYTQQMDNEWEKPKNIGYPINTSSNNVGLFVSLDGQYAYFSTKKKDGRKDYDILQFDLPEAARPDKVALIRGTITNDQGKPDPDASLELTNLKSKEVLKIGIDEVNGQYSAAVRVSDGEDHLLTLNKEGGAFSSKYISEETIAGSSTPVVDQNLEVQPLEKGREYKLNDIYFASNSAELNIAARAVIEAFKEFLNANPSVKVEIQGHTDEVGSSSANQALSAKRAKSVFDYLVAQGISANRLKHKGYGESRPVANNSSEEGKALNRRTVFVLSAQ